MRIESLQYFIATAETKSMTLASELLHVSQQSISKEIQALEFELGTQLLIRSSKGVTLSDDGRKAYLYAIDCLSLINKFSSLFKQQNYTYSLAYFSGFNTIIDNILNTTKTMMPNITFNEFSLTSGQIEQELFKGSFDFIYHQIEHDTYTKLISSENYKHFILLTESLKILLHTQTTFSDVFPIEQLSKFQCTFITSSAEETSLYQKIAEKYGYSGALNKANRISKTWGNMNNKNNAALITKSLIPPKSSDMNFSSINIKLLPVSPHIQISTIFSIKKELADNLNISPLLDISKIYFQKYKED